MYCFHTYLVNVLKTNMVDPQNGSEYVQVIYLIKDLYLEYIKNSFNYALYVKLYNIECQLKMKNFLKGGVKGNKRFNFLV